MCVCVCVCVCVYIFCMYELFCCKIVGTHPCYKQPSVFILNQQQPVSNSRSESGSLLAKYGCIPTLRASNMLNKSLMFALVRSAELVSWCFEPSQPQRITSGLNTNFTLPPSYSFQKSFYHKSCFVLFLAYLYSVGNTGTCIKWGDLFYSVGLYRNRC